MTPIKAYRIVELDKITGKPKTLFHAIPHRGRRSRVIPQGEWLGAEVKPVTDGTSDTVYSSGFNVLLDLTELRKYMVRFKKDRELVIVEVQIDRDTMRRKSHSRSPVFLAEHMMLPVTWKPM